MLVILDRDGVINADSSEYIKSPEEWLAIPGSLEAIAKLNQAGHQVVVVTNQSGVGRGYYDEQTLENIHQKMTRALAAVGGHLDGIFYCPHSPEDQCSCRKPKPGLLYQVAAMFPTDFTDAVLVGDSLRDYQAAQAVSCKFILVKTGNGEKVLAEGKLPVGVDVYEDLAAYVNYRLKSPN
ncbi:MAG TPA: D-glycero-beta-D-manno-heptose 1,7-bisphosphate 7-phosphatase [Gammaproteobacteria bacterium]|nr:D-glycero-beta-D-manno-heptose 1,7-bisphosphate 7-phosphatase [Gammaproteobacteria bacterium]